MYLVSYHALVAKHGVAGALQQMDLAGSDDFDDILKTLAQATDREMAILAVINSQSGAIVGAHGMAKGTVKRHLPLPKGNGPVFKEIDDYTAAFPTSELLDFQGVGARSVAIQYLASDGKVFGGIAVMSTKKRPPLGPFDRALMAEVAELFCDLIEMKVMLHVVDFNIKMVEGRE